MTQNNTERAEKCPFCEATPHKERSKIMERPNSGERYQLHVLRCPHGHAQASHETWEGCLKVWNTRAMTQPVAEQSLQSKDACSEPCVRRLSEDEAVGVMIEPIKRFLEVSRRLAQIDPKPEDLDDHSMILARDAYRALLVAQGGQAVAPEVAALVGSINHALDCTHNDDGLCPVCVTVFKDALQPFTGVQTDDK